MAPAPFLNDSAESKSHAERGRLVGAAVFLFVTTVLASASAAGAVACESGRNGEGDNECC